MKFDIKIATEVRSNLIANDLHSILLLVPVRRGHGLAVASEVSLVGPDNSAQKFCSLAADYKCVDWIDDEQGQSVAFQLVVDHLVVQLFVAGIRQLFRLKCRRRRRCRRRSEDVIGR